MEFNRSFLYSVGKIKREIKKPSSTEMLPLTGL